jgi:hypothetical protein
MHTEYLEKENLQDNNTLELQVIGCEAMKWNNPA